MNKKGEMSFEQIIMIILQIFAFAGLLSFVYFQANGSGVYEEAYAKQIALVIDKASSEMQIKMNFTEGIKIAESNLDRELTDEDKKKIVRLENGKVFVVLGDSRGYSYNYFSNYDISLYFENNNLVINIGKKLLDINDFSEVSYDMDVSLSNFKKIMDNAISHQLVLSECKKYENLIWQESKNNNVNPILVLAIISQESGCKIDVDSGSSVGVMQINRIHCGDYELSSNVEDCVSELKIFVTNIRVGIKILLSGYDEDSKKYKCEEFISEISSQKEYFIDKYYSGWERALRSYNGWGCAGYRKDGSEIFADHDYVENVIKKYKEMIESI